MHYKIYELIRKLKCLVNEKRKPHITNLILMNQPSGIIYIIGRNQKTYKTILDTAKLLLIF